LPPQLRGTYSMRTKWNGTTEIVISDQRITYKDAHIMPAEVIVSDGSDEAIGGRQDRERPRAAEGTTRLRFTVFCPNQTTEWVRGAVGVIESFDVVFTSEGSSFEGTFRRQGEGILPTEGERMETIEERAARIPALVRSKSSDKEDGCPICLSNWEEEGVVQTQTECGHTFCLKCVVSTCNMTPPNTSGTCPLCRQTVTISGLLRVERTAVELS